jgi:hypothetical protein
MMVLLTDLSHNLIMLYMKKLNTLERKDKIK